MASFADLANPWVAGLPVYEPGKPIEEVARELGFDSAAEIVKIASNEKNVSCVKTSLSWRNGEGKNGAPTPKMSSASLEVVRDVFPAP